MTQQEQITALTHLLEVERQLSAKLMRERNAANEKLMEIGINPVRDEIAAKDAKIERLKSVIEAIKERSDMYEEHELGLKHLNTIAIEALKK